MIRLIVCDLDGTLLTSHQGLDLVSWHKIEEKRNQGIEFMIATGRDFNMVKEICDEYDIKNTMILNNGTQYRSYNGDINICYPMEEDSFRNIIEILQKYDYHISIHTTKGKYILEDKETYFQKHIDLLLKSKNITDASLLPKAAFFTREGYLNDTTSVNNIDELYHSGALPLKIDARHSTFEEAKSIIEEIHEIPHLHISSSYEENIEITCDLYDKGTMLKKVLQDKGLKEDEVATFGDGLNDIGLLDFPYSFAPSNAPEVVKEKASFALSLSNDEGAVKEGIEILEKKKLI